MIRTFITLLIFATIPSCKPGVQGIYLGQGIIAGEVTSTSVILQSRLTASDTLNDGDLAGKRGVGMFQVDR